MPRKSRGDRNAMWVEKYCLVPSGFDRGQRVRLTDMQRDVICKIYDYAESVPITGPLAAYLTLLHTCGPEALRGGDDQQLKFETDIFTAWAATGPDLRAVLKRDGELIICPELGTRYPAAA